MAAKRDSRGLSKCATGIQGLDEITSGGLPRGRPTLVCGSAGCGKTLLATEFIVRGATEFNEPGVFVSFEETSGELTRNVRSLGFDLDDLVRRRKLAMDYVRVERSEIEETGEYDLEALFVRLNYAIDSVKARRVVLDTIEALFGGLSNTAILRAELRRLFAWLKDKGVTAIITGERGEGGLTRHGIEEYVSDCVIVLDHRVIEQISTRRLRVVKYRGSTHGTNEYPFIITAQGLSVVPITSMRLDYDAGQDRISSGIPRLDAMLGGKGYYRGSTILLSGTAGCGKSSLAARFAEAACQRGERCLYIAFEESERQVTRNMESIGIDLARPVRRGLLRFEASRPALCGLEMHLVNMHLLVEAHRPSVVVIDPVTNFLSAGNPAEVRDMLMRLIDYLKGRRITTLATSLTRARGEALEQTDAEISSLIDTWILLRDIESNGERNRGIYVLKSRGMAHSNQIREFRLTGNGIEILDVYVGPGELLTGSARLNQEAMDREQESERAQAAGHRQRRIQAEQKALQAQIAALQARLVARQDELQSARTDERNRIDEMAADRSRMTRSRRASENGRTRAPKRGGR
jgi:circadian clock protein KaiC